MLSLAWQEGRSWQEGKGFEFQRYKGYGHQVWGHSGAWVKPWILSFFLKIGDENVKTTHMKNTPNDPNDWTFLGNQQLMSRKMHRKASVFWYPKGHPLDSVHAELPRIRMQSRQDTSSGEATGTQLVRDHTHGSKIWPNSQHFVTSWSQRSHDLCFWGIGLGLAGCEKSLLMFVYFCYFIIFHSDFLARYGQLRMLEGSRPSRSLRSRSLGPRLIRDGDRYRFYQIINLGFNRWTTIIYVGFYQMDFLFFKVSNSNHPSFLGPGF